MKRILKTTLIGAGIALSLPTSLMARHVGNMDQAREELARGVATLAADPGFDIALREHLAKGKASLSEVLTDLHAPASAQAVEHLRDLERQAIELRGLTGALDALIDVRVHGVEENDPMPAIADFWTGTLSRDPVSGAKQVVAFDTTGAEHRFPAEAMPSQPMLIVESDSDAALRAGVKVMNETMRRNGMQTEKRATRSRGTVSVGSIDAVPGGKAEQLTILKKIWLDNDHEPNTAGDAEIFAIVSGIGPDGKPQIMTKDMPWLDHDKRWYSPGMDLINWSDYSSGYVNVQLFEEDGSTNFKELALRVTEAVGDLSLLIAPEAPPTLIITGVTKIGQEILKAMPSDWFQNKADYVDSYYVIERGGDYGTDDEPLRGARGQSKMILKPYKVKNG